MFVPKVHVVGEHHLRRAGGFGSRTFLYFFYA